jgi:hypothetical protein
LVKNIVFLSYACVSVVFFNKDRLPEYTNNREKEALLFIQKESKKGKTFITVPIECPILAWGIIDDFQHSSLNSIFLKKMNIVDRNIRYRNK